ncbi:MAG: hypothetical protein ACSHYA_20275 [Opitutaceae bacterium]
MKIKKRYVGGAIGLLSLIYYFFTGGLFISLGGEFTYVLSENYDCSKPDPPKEDRIYIPDDYHFKYTTTSIPTLLYVWRVNYKRIPCSMQLYMCDPTYLESDADYKSFCIDVITVFYSDGSSLSYRKEERDFLGTEHDIETRIESIPNILEKALDAEIVISGYTRRKNGSVEPFIQTQQYTYDRYIDAWTLWEALASI